MTRTSLLLLACSCGTTLNANNYAHDCDADTDCVRVVVGDICACTCSLSAINLRDYDKYTHDYQAIGVCRTVCTDDGGDGGYTCGQGVGAACSAGTCVNVVVDAGAD